MTHPFRAFCALALTVGLIHAASAQRPAPPPPMPTAPEEGQAVSDAELDTFAEIYVDLQELNQRFETEMSAVQSQAEAQELQARHQQETISTIEGHGWSMEQYNLVAQAINADPDLLDQTLVLIEDKS